MDIKVKLTGWAFLEIREKPVPFSIEQATPGASDEYLLKLQGIDTVEQAQLYAGHTLLVPQKKGQRKSLADGGFDLNGFHLVDQAIGEIGDITGTEELPRQTMLLTHYKGQEIMIPLVEEFIAGIDEEKEIIYLNLPEGFFDLYE